MAGQPQYQDEVRVSLTATKTTSNDGPAERHFLLNKYNDKVEIGRSTKRDGRMTAGSNNGWFDSAVMSRHHAKLMFSPRSKAVTVMDIGSLHGTFVNNNRLPHHQGKTLASNDVLRFGVVIERGKDIYPPCEMQVGLKFGPSKPGDRPIVFRVPDSTDGEDERSDVDEALGSSIAIMEKAGMATKKNETTVGACSIDLTNDDNLDLITNDRPGNQIRTDEPSVEGEATVSVAKTASGSPQPWTSDQSASEEQRSEVDLSSCNSSIAQLVVDVDELSEYSKEASIFGGDVESDREISQEDSHGPDSSANDPCSPGVKGKGSSLLQRSISEEPDSSDALQLPGLHFEIDSDMRQDDRYNRYHCMTWPGYDKNSFEKSIFNEPCTWSSTVKPYACPHYMPPAQSGRSGGGLPSLLSHDYAKYILPEQTGASNHALEPTDMQLQLLPSLDSELLDAPTWQSIALGRSLPKSPPGSPPHSPKDTFSKTVNSGGHYSLDSPHAGEVVAVHGSNTAADPALELRANIASSCTQRETSVVSPKTSTRSSGIQHRLSQLDYEEGVAKERAPECEVSVDPRGDPGSLTQKRKIDDISTLLPEESHAREKEGDTVPRMNAVTVQSLSIAPQNTIASQRGVTMESGRPMKRLRRAAEIFGFAALGGVAVMSALIATAPVLE